MEIINDVAAQGDILFIRVDRLPEGAVLQAADGDPIVAHSESGHHHIVRAFSGYRVEHYVVDAMTSAVRIVRKRERLTEIADSATAAIDIALAGASALHEKAGPDAHEAFGLACEGEEAIYQINRQEELRPEGWARVQD